MGMWKRQDTARITSNTCNHAMDQISAASRLLTNLERKKVVSDAPFLGALGCIAGLCTGRPSGPWPSTSLPSTRWGPRTRHCTSSCREATRPEPQVQSRHPTVYTHQVMRVHLMGNPPLKDPASIEAHLWHHGQQRFILTSALSWHCLLAGSRSCGLWSS